MPCSVSVRCSYAIAHEALPLPLSLAHFVEFPFETLGLMQRHPSVLYTTGCWTCIVRMSQEVTSYGCYKRPPEETNICTKFVRRTSG